MASKTCAIVFVTTQYQSDQNLEPIPQAINNCVDLFSFLRSSPTLEIQDGDLFFGVNPTMDWVYERLDDVSKKKPTHFIFYYCGHGIPVGEELVLPLAGTKRVALQNASLQHRLLAQKIRELNCTSLVILDTCYSERFLRVLSDEGAIAQELVSDFVGNEVVAIASAKKYAGISHPEGRHTLFSGECIKILREGPLDECQYLTARSLFDSLKEAMNKLGGPTPSISGDGKNFFLCERKTANPLDGNLPTSETKQNFLPSTGLLLSLPSHSYLPERDGFSIHRHDYGYRRVPFIAFKETNQRINSFLYDSKDKPVSWMVIEGTGGSGKSRLALEVCLAAKQKGWDAGFFQIGHYQSARFAFHRSSLVIFDDAETAYQSAENLLLSLNADPPPPGVLVRVMLLTRGRYLSREDGIDFPWWRTFQASGLASILVDQSERSGFDSSTLVMPVFTKNEISRLIQHVLTEIGINPESETNDINRLVDLFSEIDKFRRPLFATFFAEAIATHGVSGIREWNRRDLLRHCLNKELLRWEFSRQSAAVAGLLTLSCVAGGEGLRICDEASKKGLPIPSNPDLKTLSALIGYNKWEDGCLIPLEPDVLGELFVLSRLKGSLTLQSESPVEASNGTGQIIRFVLEAKGDRGKEFLRRCISDFPEDDLVDCVVDLLCECIVPDEVEFLGEIADALANNRNLRSSSRLVERVLHEEGRLSRRDFSMFALRMARIDIERNRFLEGESLLLELANCKVFESYSDRHLLGEVRILLAKTFFAQGKLEKARAELQEIRRIKDLPESIRFESDDLMGSVVSSKKSQKLNSSDSAKARKTLENAKNLLATMKKERNWKLRRHQFDKIMELIGCPEVKDEACILMIETYLSIRRGDAARVLHEKCKESGCLSSDLSVNLAERNARIQEMLNSL